MRWSHLITRPLGTIIGWVLRARHWCYDRGVLSTHVPSVPTIAIGNLSLGGTGKTPHVELMVRILLNHRVHPIATLSRGYGRMTKGFREVRPEDAAHAVGDEPLQLKLAYPALHVFVGTDRADAVQQIVTLVPGTRIVLLDDALQHRRITAGLSVLLTTYARPFCSDQLLPEGTLRDIPARAIAMDVVIVTKCPKDADRDPLVWRKKLRMRRDQELFFSEEHHLCPTWADPKREGAIPTGTGTKAVLFTGIASAASLLDHCRIIWDEVEHVPFRDHHAFSTSDLERLASLFDTFAAGRGVLVTTAKDAARARHLLPGSALDGLPLVIIGVEARILDRQNEFETIIMTHARPH